MRLVELARVTDAQRNLVGIGKASLRARVSLKLGKALEFSVSIKNPNIILNSSGFQQEHSSLLAPVLLRNPSSLKI